MPKISDLSPIVTGDTSAAGDYAPIVRAGGGQGKVDVTTLSAAAASRYSGVYNVKTNGASVNKTRAENAAAFNATIAEANAAGSGTVLVPRGTWPLVDNLTRLNWGVQMVADGRGRTVLEFDVTAHDKILLSAGDGVSQLNNSGFRGFTVRTTDRTYRKTAIKMQGASGGCFIEDIDMRGVVSSVGGHIGAADSICVHMLGHEQVRMRGLDLYGSVPIRLGVNPIAYPGHSAGWLSSDHFSIADCLLNAGDGTTAQPLASSLIPANIWVENGADIHNLKFEGFQAWLGGRYGLYFVYNTAVGDQNSALVISNVRTEQMYMPHDKPSWSVYIANNTATNSANGERFLNLTIKQCHFPVQAPLNDVNQPDTGGGIYLKGISNITIDDTILPQVTTRSIHVAPVYPLGTWRTDTMSLNIRNIQWNTQGLLNTISVPPYLKRTSMTQGPGPNSTARNLLTSATWMRESVSSVESNGADSSVGDLDLWTRTYRVAAGTTLKLPLNFDYVGVRNGTLEVIGSGITKTSTVAIYGKYQLSPVNVGVNGVELLAGKNAVASGSTSSGNVRVFADSSGLGANVNLTNDTAETLDVMMKAEYTRKPHFLSWVRLSGGLVGWHWLSGTSTLGGTTYNNPILLGGSALPDSNRFLFASWVTFRAPSIGQTMQRVLALSKVVSLNVVPIFSVERVVSTTYLQVKVRNSSGTTTVFTSTAGVAQDVPTLVLVSASALVGVLNIWTFDGSVWTNILVNAAYSTVVNWSGHTIGDIGYDPENGWSADIDLAMIYLNTRQYLDFSTSGGDLTNHRLFVDGLVPVSWTASGYDAGVNPFIYIGGSSKKASPYRMGWAFNEGGPSYAYNRATGSMLPLYTGLGGVEADVTDI